MSFSLTLDNQEKLCSITATNTEPHKQAERDNIFISSLICRCDNLHEVTLYCKDCEYYSSH